ncbi:hypothetical protein M9Y10_029768 [Tritrichomonas musculus]|uniref:SAM-dependent MTase RsmB/NOP-type domain-containing protein n=1 Tax=Tritrichomonas musculus TaxID=1915356 RepID=A0ABR2KRC3_9EUKA
MYEAKNEKIKSSQYISDLHYFSYYEKLLNENNIKKKSFHKMLEASVLQNPQIFRIKAKDLYEKKLINDLDIFLNILKKADIKAEILDFLKEKYGTIAQVFYSKINEKNNPSLKNYSEWLNINTEYKFIARFPFSALLPYIFLDVQPNDTILSCGKNNFQSCDIICDILKDGYIFINVSDIKLAKTVFDLNCPNCCVISYPILSIPIKEEFDKVLCIVPSIEDGDIPSSKTDEKADWSLEKAIRNHEEQKKYLISSLEKVKIGGICVYSSYSLNPFENECVINSVLKMPQFSGKLEIVNCSEMVKEIKRKKGLTKWSLEGIDINSKDENLLKSISNDELIENIENCMRFYPHQIHSTGTFIAVIKKIDKIDQKSFEIIQTNFKSFFTITPQKLIQKTIDDFGLAFNNEQELFISKQVHKKSFIYYVHPNLMNLLNDDYLTNLNIIQIGSIAFTILNKNEPFIPTVHHLPAFLKNPTKRLICIKLIDFDDLNETKEIPLDRLIDEKTTDQFPKSNGGVFICLEGFGPLIGGYVEDKYLKITEKKEELNMINKIVKNFVSEKFGEEQMKDKKTLFIKERYLVFKDKLIAFQKEYVEKVNELKGIIKEKEQTSQHLIDQIAQNEKEIKTYRAMNNDKTKIIGELNESMINQIRMFKSKLDKYESSNCNFCSGLSYLHKADNGKDTIHSILYLERSSAEGNQYASFLLGLLYSIGDGVEQNIQRSIEYYQKAADLGCSSALNNLGYMYQKGNGVERNISKAIEYYKKAADLEDPTALYNLGSMYENGNGVELNISKAIEFYQKAADLENPPALHNLGEKYEKGIGVEQDNSKAFEYYQRAADLGYVPDLNNLGYRYEHGQGVEQSYEKAVEYYKKAADFGNPTSMNNLGSCYFNGKGVEQNMTKAIELYQKADKIGCSYASYNLGLCYLGGSGVEKDTIKGKVLIKKAADLGHPKAKEMVLKWASENC